MVNEFIEPGAYNLVEDPPDDMRSVRLGNSGVTDTTVYIFTYGQEEEHYGVHIEYPNLTETNYKDTIDTYENIPLSTLVNMLITHLEIPLDKIRSNDCC